MRMFLDRTEAMEDAVWAIPRFELSVHDDGEFGEGSEVSGYEARGVGRASKLARWG